MDGWVWSNGGMILTAETEVMGQKPVPEPLCALPKDFLNHRHCRSAVQHVPQFQAPICAVQSLCTRSVWHSPLMKLALSLSNALFQHALWTHGASSGPVTEHHALSVPLTHNAAPLRNTVYESSNLASRDVAVHVCWHEPSWLQYRHVDLGPEHAHVSPLFHTIFTVLNAWNKIWGLSSKCVLCNRLQTDSTINCSWRPSPYRAVNTPYVLYKPVS